MIEKTNKILTTDVSNLISQVAVLEIATAGEVSKIYIDGSLSTRDASIAWISLNLPSGDVTRGYVDGSLAVLNASVGIALRPYATNASVGLVVTTINASIGLMATNASVGKVIKYVTGAGIGLKNASGNLYDLTYVDASAYLKVGATSWLQWVVSTTSLG